MKLGELDIYLVSDGTFRAEAQGPFGLVPQEKFFDFLKPDHNNTVPLMLTCLLVVSEGKKILIETGLGNKLNESVKHQRGITRTEGGLIDNLARIGFRPDDIDIVINTHLHDDHCGGNTILVKNKLSPTFSNATYYVQRIEWANASHPDERTKWTYLEENFSILVKSGQMKLLHGDTNIAKNVRCVVTPGHTRGHQSVLIQSDGWKGLFVSDMATYSVHMQRVAWVTAYDIDPLENISTKKKWREWATAESAWIFFYHDPIIPVGQLVEIDEHIQIRSPKNSSQLFKALPGFLK